ncbi:putative isocitrate dehydrogenase, NAD-dependent [Cooperia oncophora]
MLSRLTPLAARPLSVSSVLASPTKNATVAAIRTHKLPGERLPLAKYGGRHTVVALPGDGIGPEMIDHIRTIFKYCHVCTISSTVLPPLDHIFHAQAPINFETVQVSANLGEGDLDAAIIAIKRNGVAIKGNIETKHDDPEFKSRNVELRTKLDLYANILHCVSIPTIPTRHQDIDIVLIRENTEGEYSGLEHETLPGIEGTEVKLAHASLMGVSFKILEIQIVTRPCIERLARMAFEYAALNNRKKVTAVHKANIQKLGDGLFLQVIKEMAKSYPQIEFESMIVDNACMQLVSRPQQFDVMVMPNLYGNIISNIACGLVGGPGLVSGMNLGDQYAIFETVFGWPIGSIANLISDALWKALVDQRMHTRDVGGSHKASEVVNVTLENIANMMDMVR